MKKNILIITIIFMIIISTGCGNETLIGKWSLTEVDEKESNEKFFMEFLKDGTVSASNLDEWIGTYIIDETVQPTQMILNVNEYGETEIIKEYLIYKIENDTLVIKVAEYDNYKFADNFRTEKGYSLMKFRRE